MDLFLQLLWNGIVSGSLIALVALGLTLIYGIAGFIQFAHGELVAAGAYLFLVFHVLLGWTILPSAGMSVFLVVILSLVLEKLFFKPVRDHDAMIPLVISLGLSIGLQSLFLLVFGPGVRLITNKTFESYSVGNSDFLVVTPPQLWGMVLALLLVGALLLFLNRTRTGKSLRAVSCNRSIAEVFGIHIDTAMAWIFGIGGALAALAGIVLGFEQNISPHMGVMIGVKAFSAVILGGVGSVRGALVGAYLIGLSESLFVGFGIVPSGFSGAIPFIILIGMLLVRPEGLFARRFEHLR